MGICGDDSAMCILKAQENLPRIVASRSRAKCEKPRTNGLSAKRRGRPRAAEAATLAGAQHPGAPSLDDQVRRRRHLPVDGGAGLEPLPGIAIAAAGVGGARPHCLNRATRRCRILLWLSVLRFGCLLDVGNRQGDEKDSPDVTELTYSRDGSMLAAASDDIVMLLKKRR
ncbi:hypothetical protein GCM10023178_34800 [Actinomadura luteofluorescens]